MNKQLYNIKKIAAMEKDASSLAPKLFKAIPYVGGLGSLAANTVDKPKEVGANIAKSIFTAGGTAAGALAGIGGLMVPTPIATKMVKLMMEKPKLFKVLTRSSLLGGALLGGVGTHKFLNLGRD